MVAADPRIVDVNRAMLDSMHNACTIRRERWMLRVNEVESNRLFEGLEAKDDDTPEKHDDDVNQAHTDSFASFASHNDNETGPSGAGVVDLTFDGDGDGKN